jgi:hypothetical protein
MNQRNLVRGLLFVLGPFIFMIVAVVASVPGGLPLMFFVLAVAFVARAVLNRRGLNRELGQWELHVRGTCPQCGYDLRANRDHCPECGLALPKSEFGPQDPNQPFEEVLGVRAAPRRLNMDATGAD